MATATCDENVELCAMVASQYPLIASQRYH